MADIRDGSANDNTVQNALLPDDDTFETRTIDIGLLDDDFNFTYLTPSKQISVKAGEIKKANIELSSDIEEGELKDSSGKIYFLFQNENLLYELVQTGKLIGQDEAKAPPLGNITLTLDSYRAYLKIVIENLEKISFYSKLTAKIHRESVQDAVDIIQSKRLDFAETKDEEVDVVGIFSTVLTIFIFEAGIAEMIFRKISLLMTKLASKTFIRKALNVFFAFVGSKSGRSQLIPKLKELEKELIRLQAKSKTLNENALAAILATDKAARASGAKAEEVLRLNNIAVKLQQKSRSAFSAGESTAKEKDLLSARLKDELIVIGKQEVDDFQKLVKDTTGQNIDQIKGKTKEAIAGVISGSGEQKPVEIPLDVYFKSSIQNLYEERALLFERFLLLSRSLLNNFELMGLGSDQNSELHIEYLELLPSPEELQRSIKEYEEIFGVEFSYSLSKEIQTEEYEFMIWCLLLKSKVRPFTTNHKEDVLAIARLFMNEEQIKNLPANKDTITIRESIANYISKRFNIGKGLTGDALKIEIAGKIVAVIRKIDETMNIVNEQLNKSTEERYKANLIPKTQ